MQVNELRQMIRILPLETYFLGGNMLWLPKRLYILRKQLLLLI